MSGYLFTNNCAQDGDVIAGARGEIDKTPGKPLIPNEQLGDLSYYNEETIVQEVPLAEPPATE